MWQERVLAHGAHVQEACHKHFVESQALKISKWVRQKQECTAKQDNSSS